MKKLVLVVVAAVALLMALVTPTGAQQPAPSPPVASPTTAGPDTATAATESNASPVSASDEVTAAARSTQPASESVSPAPAVSPAFAIAIVETGPFVPGQHITVQVSGGRASATVAVAQCDLALTACSDGGYVTLDPAGAGSVDLGVHRRVAGPGPTVVDCALSPCQVYAQQYGMTVEAVASLPIEVDPSAPVPKPTLRVVTPGPIQGTGPVTIEGSGYDPLDYLQLFECSWDPPSAIVPCAQLPGSATTDATGAFSVPVSVSRVLLGTDCAVRVWRCQVWAVSYGNVDSIWAVPLQFDGSAPPVRPAVSIDPSADLLDGQLVQVTGSGFAPSASVRIAQCSEGPGSGGSCPTIAYVPTDASGGFVQSVAVGRMMGDDDCTAVRCWLRVVGPPVDTVDVDLGFDASVPPPPPLSLTVEPATDLADRQTVTVTVAPVRSTGYVSVAECLAGTDQCRSLPTSITIPPDGTVATDVVVRRSPVTGVDCAVVACDIRASVYQGGFSKELRAPIAFDPDAPPAPPPNVRVLPATGLWDRQRVTVRGEGFDSWDYLSAIQCVVDPVVTASCAVSVASIPADAAGNVSGTAMVRRYLDLPGGQQDCAVAACVISLSGSSWSAVIPIAFDPDGPVVGDDLPPQLECVSWPTQQWPTGPIPQGVDPAAVAALGQEMVTNQGDSVVVIHGGRLVYENYGAGLDSSSIFTSFSVSKTFAATMVGLLVDDGLIDIDHTSLFPEWSAPGDPRSAISTRNILNMASGLEWTENYGDPNSDVIKLVQSPDPAALVVAKPLQHAPGSYWQYSTGDTMLLSRIIGDAAGVSGPTYEAMLHERLFDPLGIDPVIAGFDDAGRWKAGWLTNTTTRNFAKLGLLYLRHGVWEDQQFLSTDWVDFVRAPSPASSGYGGQVWLNGDGSFSMIGVGGQTVLIVPWLDLIVAVNNGGDAGAMARLFDNAAAPSCGATPASLADDATTVDTDGSVLVDVLGNDDGGTVGLAPSTLSVSTPPAHGVAVVEAGAVRYQPAAGYSGSDTFDYLVCTADRRSCLEATVTVTVATPPGAPPEGRSADRRSGWLTLSAHP